MGRTKQAPPMAKKEVGPPNLAPPPPPPPSRPVPTENQRNQLSLSNILSPAALLKQKKTLKTVDTRRVTLTRQDLLSASNTTQYLQLKNCCEFLKVQSQTADITVLDLSGMEQLSDIFLYTLKINDLMMPALQELNISGCMQVSDLGIHFLCQSFRSSSLMRFQADGCRELTEKSLCSLQQTYKELSEISMMGTSISVLPHTIGAQLILDGCPLISPPQKRYATNTASAGRLIEHSCFKMVVLSDKDLDWNPLGLIMNDKSMAPTNQIQIRTGVSINKHTYNIFQLPHLSPMLDLVISEGCIVAIPFSLQDNPDFYYINDIVQKMLTIFVKCPEVQFLLIGVTDQSGMSTKKVVKAVMDMFMGRIRKTKEEVERVIIKRKQLRFGTIAQKTLTNAVRLLQNCPPACPLEHFVGQCLLQVDSDNKKQLASSMKTATDYLVRRFPVYFMPYYEDLSDVISKVEKAGSQLCTVLQTPREVQDIVARNFAIKENIHVQHLEKIYSFMARMGKLLYLPDETDSVVLSDLILLENMSAKLLMQEAPDSATWRYLGANKPCWTLDSLTGILPDKEKAALMVSQLQKAGVMLKMPRDRWTTEIKDVAAYVITHHLPKVPFVDIDNIWPDEGDDELQVERMIHFYPGISTSFFSHVVRECIEMGGVRLMWNTGIIISKGPVTLLIEIMFNYNEIPVLWIAGRLQNGKVLYNENHVAENGTYTLKENSMLQTLFGTVKLYKSMIYHLAVSQNLYFVDKVPCSRCLKTRNRYEMVNLNESQLELFSDIKIRQAMNTASPITCSKYGLDIDTSLIIGPKTLNEQLSLVPTHYYLGCVPSFSSYNRCLFCHNCAALGSDCPGNLENGKTAWNCSCDQEGLMCDQCGICQRCDSRLSNVVAMFYPKFSKIGSMNTLKVNASHVHDIELTPNYAPLMEVTLLDDTDFRMDMKMGPQEVRYQIGEGTISQHQGSTERSSKQHEDYVCKKGDVIKIVLGFSKEDISDMVLRIQLSRTEIYSLTLPAQGCKVSFLTTELPSTFIITTPLARNTPEVSTDDFGEKKMCFATPGLHCKLEAELLLGKQYIETALFQAGGVNYSGASYLFLPREITPEKLQVPSYLYVKQEQVAAHLLCYTRSKISDTLTFSSTVATPETWSVYRMIHLVDNAGIVLDDQMSKMYDNCNTLLWAWNFIFKLLSKVTLPKTFTSLVGTDLSSLELKQVESGLADLLDLMFWQLTSRVQTDSVLPVIDNHSQMLKQAEILHHISEEHSKDLGLQPLTSIYNENSVLYLCEGHTASVNVERGLVQILPQVYGTYAEFLLSVDLPSNQLTEIPEEAFTVLANLREFDCSRNFIEVIPNSISCCKKLYSLTLSENNLTDLPGGLVQCKELWRLDISANIMEKLPSVVSRIPSLFRLYANNMFLTYLPDSIGNLVNLDKLYLNGNCFTSLPKGFTKLKSLTDLGLSGVPYSISKAKKVMSYENFITKLTMWRFDRWLEAHKQEKDELFKIFDEDSNGVLDEVEMGKLSAALFNMFPRFGYKGQTPPDDDMPSGFPMEVLECRNLEYLDMYYHGLVSVPKEIGQLQEMKVLNLSYNPNLLTLPAEIGTLSCLIRLQVEECPLLKTPPKEIRAKGFSTVFAYLKRLSSGSMPCKRTKLMMVGLGGAGKTSLVEALLSRDGKADLTHGEAITDGIDISTWTVRHDNEGITFSVWDFAGQTVYYNTHQFFLSNRAVYLLVWNVRLGYEHAGLDFWLSSISVQAPKAPIFVVGSHVDQVSKFEIPIQEMKARYKQIAGFHFVSSYTGQGIKELQDNLFETTLQQQYMGEQIPEVWLSFENNVISARGNSNVIEYKALEKLANLSGIFDKQEVDQAVQFLHELGSLQHFTTELLKTKVVINPQWIVDVMACIVSVKNSPIQDGRLAHKDISVVWKDYPSDLHDWLLKLTEEYDLTFPLENQSANLVPCLLPEKPPDELSWPELDKESDMKENKMIYKFEYLPAGLFNRGQVRLHQISDSALIWKKGSFLKKNGHIALLQQTRDSELKVTVQGPRPENVIFLVHEVFEGLISESFRGVTYDFLIPCPDCLRMYAKDPHMFAASTIRRALELKAPFLQCIKQFHTISCIDLLACMPPDSHSDFDIHLVQSVRNLRDLRKDLSADIFFTYCEKDAPLDRTSLIHPSTVCDDMKALGYKCWFPEIGRQYKIEEMARALTDAAVVVVFMSQAYAKNEECVNIFKYARLTLKKPMVLVAVGDGFEWKQSKLGILLADEVFVNMIKSKKDVYQSKLEELIKAVHNRSNKTLTHANITPSCFFSYTWVNSAGAVALGTRKIKGAIGNGDPRQIKDYLETNGVKCWIDIERIGQNGLFDDIAEGLLSAKVVVVCVSDEYASSPTCQIEFRYAANTLKLPIIMAVVGTGNKWRASEVGVLSLKYPLVSFQEKSDTAYNTLLELVKQQLDANDTETVKAQKNKMNEKQKNLSFQELFELAQRKLLRQLCFYAEHQDIEIFPRLFVVDFVKKQPDKNIDNEDHVSEEAPKGDKPAPKHPPLIRQESRSHLSKKHSSLKPVIKLQHFCVHILCEHDEGWHSVADPLALPGDFGEQMLEKFSPFVARVTAVMKYNKQFNFNCRQHELGEDYLHWLEENPQATMSDYQQVYHEFRKLVLELDSKRILGDLARCRLPNGKTIWLCGRHRSAMKVTILTSEATQREVDRQQDTDTHMITALRVMDHKHYADKFTSSTMTKRKLDPNAAPPKHASIADGNFELLPDKKLKRPDMEKNSTVPENIKKKGNTEESESKPEKQKDVDSAEEKKAPLAKSKSKSIAIIEEDMEETETASKTAKEIDDSPNEIRQISKADDDKETSMPQKRLMKGMSKQPATKKQTATSFDSKVNTKGGKELQMDMVRAKTFFGGQTRTGLSKTETKRPSSAQKPDSSNKSKACSIC